jgi:hypothetical protein
MIKEKKKSALYYKIRITAGLLIYNEKPCMS